MGAMTNAMGSIGGSINKVGKGVVGGVKQVGGQMGVPGMGGKPQPGGQPPGAVPGQQPGPAATAQPGEGGALPEWKGPAASVPQGTGPAGGAPGGASPPFLPGGLPGMMPQLQKTPGQLTATGALGKQPAQTTMQKLMGAGGVARLMRQAQLQQAMQPQLQPQQLPAPPQQPGQQNLPPEGRIA